MTETVKFPLQRAQVQSALERLDRARRERNEAQSSAQHSARLTALKDLEIEATNQLLAKKDQGWRP